MARTRNGNEVTSSLEETLRGLRALAWDWSRDEASRLARSLNLRPCGGLPGRVSYVTNEGQDVSVYYEAESPRRVEITLDAFHDPHLLSESAYEDKVDEFYGKFEGAVAKATGILGKPLFNDGRAASGFPEDEDAVWLALWRLPNARLMIQQRHEDKELPLRLVVVVRPLRP